MAFYAVCSGDLLRCVEAKSHREACSAAAMEYLAEHGIDQGLRVGEIFQVHRLGDPDDETVFLLSEVVRADLGDAVRHVRT